MLSLWGIPLFVAIDLVQKRKLFGLGRLRIHNAESRIVKIENPHSEFLVSFRQLETDSANDLLQQASSTRGDIDSSSKSPQKSDAQKKSPNEIAYLSDDLVSLTIQCMTCVCIGKGHVSSGDYQAIAAENARWETERVQQRIELLTSFAKKASFAKALESVVNNLDRLNSNQEFNYVESGISTIVDSNAELSKVQRHVARRFAKRIGELRPSDSMGNREEEIVAEIVSNRSVPFKPPNA